MISRGGGTHSGPGLMYIKAARRGRPHCRAMADPDTLREIERLKTLAEWYCAWAKVAGNDAARDARLKLAKHIAEKAQVLAERA